MSSSELLDGWISNKVDSTFNNFNISSEIIKTCYMLKFPRLAGSNKHTYTQHPHFYITRIL